MQIIVIDWNGSDEMAQMNLSFRHTWHAFAWVQVMNDCSLWFVNLFNFKFGGCFSDKRKVFWLDGAFSNYEKLSDDFIFQFLPAIMNRITIYSSVILTLINLIILKLCISPNKFVDIIFGASMIHNFWCVVVLSFVSFACYLAKHIFFVGFNACQWNGRHSTTEKKRQRSHESSDMIHIYLRRSVQKKIRSEKVERATKKKNHRKLGNNCNSFRGSNKRIAKHADDKQIYSIKKRLIKELTHTMDVTHKAATFERRNCKAASIIKTYSHCYIFIFFFNYWRNWTQKEIIRFLFCIVWIMSGKCKWARARCRVCRFESKCTRTWWLQSPQKKNTYSHFNTGVCVSIRSH